MTTQGPGEPPRIRVARSVTLAVGPNYEKAEFEVEATAGEGVGEAIQRAQAILEEYVRNFRQEREQPPKSEIPSNTLGVGVGVGVDVGIMPWKPWTSGGGESLREDLDPKLASFLLESARASF